MNKQEMLEKFFVTKEQLKEQKEAENYKEAQEKIAEAMKQGEYSIVFPCDEYCIGRQFPWWVLPWTIEELRMDNFSVKEELPQKGYVTISWK